MLRKFGVAGLIAGAALGAVLTATPASAGYGGGHYTHGGDQQYNQNLQAVPIQSCNLDAAVGLVAVNVPILSPDTTGDCTNGPESVNID